MNLHFKTKWLYMKYIKDVPPYKGETPEYPLWVLLIQLLFFFCFFFAFRFVESLVLFVLDSGFKANVDEPLPVLNVTCA